MPQLTIDFASVGRKAACDASGKNYLTQRNFTARGDPAQGRPFTAAMVIGEKIA